MILFPIAEFKHDYFELQFISHLQIESENSVDKLQSMKIDRVAHGITDISFLEQSTLVARKLDLIIRIQVLVKFYTFLESPSSSSGFLEAAAT